jgi:hypothetical protein
VSREQQQPSVDTADLISSENNGIKNCLNDSNVCVEWENRVNERRRKRMMADDSERSDGTQKGRRLDYWKA